MGRKRVLSDEGIKLFNMGFDVPAPNRGCVKTMLHNLFTSEFDTNIDSSSVQMRKASMKLYSFLYFMSTLLREKSSGKPILNVCGGSNSTFGNKKRAIIVKNPPVTPMYATHPNDNQLKNPLLVTSGLLNEFSDEDPTEAFGTIFFSDIS